MADANVVEPEAAEDGAAEAQYPPPGPTNWVTDGYPHRKTDPRNWPTNDAHARESDSLSPQAAQNGAAPSVGQRDSRSRLKELLDRWLR